MNTYQQEHYQNCKDNSSVLIDEISMVSDTMLTYISRRLSDIKASNHAFENMNVIVIGDFFQLIQGKFAFQNTLLWQLFHPIFLHDNMRKSGDMSSAELLNRAIVGILTENYLYLHLLVNRMTFNSKDIANCLHIFPLRQDVDLFNKQMLSTLNIKKTNIEAIHFCFCN